MGRAGSLKPNNRFERSRGLVFGEPRREWMIWINQLRESGRRLSFAWRCREILPNR
jgi:hypothetical protein